MKADCWLIKLYIENVWSYFSFPSYDYCKRQHTETLQNRSSSVDYYKEQNWIQTDADTPPSVFHFNKVAGTEVHAAGGAAPLGWHGWWVATAGAVLRGTLLSRSQQLEWTEPPGSKGRWQWQQFNIVSDHIFQLQFSWAVAPCAWILSKLQILTYKLQVLNTSGSEPREFLIWPHFAQASLSLLLRYAHHPLLVKVSSRWCFVSVARLIQ